MNKLITTAVLVSVASIGFGANVAKKQQVPERLDKIRLIQPAAANKNHILVCNVGNAIPADSWALVSTYAISRLQLNVWTNSIDKIDVPSLIVDPAQCQRDFGEKSKVCVFLIDDQKLPSFATVPGRLCVVNVNPLKKDTPDVQTMRDRFAKTILKGMAYAAGSGATLENGCSLFYGSSSLAGMDKTGIMVTPMAYFPMLESLRAIGDSEMLTPAMEE